MLMDVEFDTKSFDVLAAEDFVVTVVPVARLPVVWPYVESWLDSHPSLWNDAHTKDSILQYLQEERYQLWLVSKDSFIYMAFITCGVKFPSMNVAFVVWAVGRDLKKYIRVVLSGLETFAERKGLAAIYVEGRVGWGPILAKYGYKYIHTVYGKKLSKERMH